MNSSMLLFETKLGKVNKITFFRKSVRRVWGEWPIELEHCDLNWKTPSANPTRHLTDLTTHPCYEAPGDPQVKINKLQ